jgi:hypothetical protein
MYIRKEIMKQQQRQTMRNEERRENCRSTGGNNVSEGERNTQVNTKWPKSQVNWCIKCTLKYG